MTKITIVSSLILLAAIAVLAKWLKVTNIVRAIFAEGYNVVNGDMFASTAAQTYTAEPITQGVPFCRSVASWCILTAGAIGMPEGAVVFGVLMTPSAARLVHALFVALVVLTLVFFVTLVVLPVSLVSTVLAVWIQSIAVSLVMMKRGQLLPLMTLRAELAIKDGELYNRHVGTPISSIVHAPGC